MGIKVTGLNAVTMLITQTGERVVKGVSKAMQEEGEAIAALAREYAPVDEGHLEESIIVETDRDGLNGRLRVWIGIDKSVAADVGIYAAIMHEFLNIGGGTRPKGIPPGPPYYLGKLSVRKDGGSGKVGGKFLERALYAQAPFVLKNAVQAAREILK